MNKNKGLLVTLEGIDGCGKSTLLKKLIPLFKNNPNVIFTKEPGDTETGKKISKILKESGDKITAETEFLLFAADRAQHFSEIVLPELAKGKIVISDRMANSSLVYQGYGRNANISMIKKVNEWATQKQNPDIIFYIKVDIKTALERMTIRGKTTTFENRYKNFLNSLIEGYDTVFKNKKNVIVLDGNLDPTTLAKQAYEHIKSKQKKIKF